MLRNLNEVEFTIFDTETTGLEPNYGDRIVEIAGIKIRGEAKTGAFHTLVNCGRPISEAAFNVNKITEEMLKGAPTIDTVIADFLGFIENTCLCSYNVGFDLEFLNHELQLMGKNRLENIVAIDILKMARRLLPGLERYSLCYVAEKLGIKTKQEHRALSDVELTLDVFKRLKNIFYEKGIFDLGNFINLFSINFAILNDINNQKIAQIQQALDLGVKLKIQYLSRSDAQISQREVIPKEIRQEKDFSYLVGFCCLRNEERTFRIDGILHLQIL